MTFICSGLNPLQQFQNRFDSSGMLKMFLDVNREFESESQGK